MAEHEPTATLAISELSDEMIEEMVGIEIHIDLAH